MTVERQLRLRAARLHAGRTDVKVRNEVPVHDVEVDEVRAARFDVAQLVRQPRKIGGEKRRRDLDAAHWVVVGGAAAGPSMMPPSSCRLTTTVIGSRPLTGAPRKGNWRMIMPSAMPGYDSNFTFDTLSPRLSSAGRTVSSARSMRSGITYDGGAGGTPTSNETSFCAATTVPFGGSSARMPCAVLS